MCLIKMGGGNLLGKQEINPTGEEWNLTVGRIAK